MKDEIGISIIPEQRPQLKLNDLLINHFVLIIKLKFNLQTKEIFLSKSVVSKLSSTLVLLDDTKTAVRNKSLLRNNKFTCNQQRTRHANAHEVGAL